MAKKFYPGLLLVAQIVVRLLPFVKRHLQEGKAPFADLRRKYKGAATIARFVYRRGVGKGERQGRRQERAHIARRLLKMGFEPAVICKATGLTRQEVTQLNE